jgi:tetratricopeptide (TPR) repeat protein
MGLLMDGDLQWQTVLKVTPELIPAETTTSFQVLDLYLKFKAADNARVHQDWETADRLFRDVAAGIETLFPPNHPALAISDLMLAGYFRARGDEQRGEELAFRALKSYRQNIGTHTYMCDPLYQLAKFREQQKEFDKAEDLYREAYWLAGLNQKARRAFRGLTRQGLITCLLSQAKHDEAHAVLNSELEGDGAQRTEEEAVLNAWKLRVWMDAGDFATVVKELSLEKPVDASVFRRESSLARALSELGRFEEAVKIQPVSMLIDSDQLLPREDASRQTLMRRLDRWDARTVDELLEIIPNDAKARDRSFVAHNLRSLALKQIECGQFEVAGNNLAESEQIAKRRCSLNDRILFDLSLDRALLAAAMEDYGSVPSMIKAVVESACLRYSPDSFAMAEYFGQAGVIAKASGDLELARTYLDQSLKILNGKRGLWNDQVWAVALERLESTPTDDLRYEFIQGLRQRNSLHEFAEWRSAVLIHELGAAQAKAGALGGAEKLLLEAWKLVFPILGDENRLTRTIATDLSIVYAALENEQQALIWRERSGTAE